MQPNSCLLRRRAFVMVLTIACASCSSDPPAELKMLSGESAKKLAALDPPPAAPVLVAGGDKRVIAVVFDANPAVIGPLVDRLLKDEVPGCKPPPEGSALCCAEGMFWLYTEKNAWIPTGESCEARFDDKGIPFCRAPDDEQFLQDLKELEIDHPFMQLAQAPDGAARALVNGESSRPDAKPCPMKQEDSGLQSGSQVILAGHRILYPSPPGYCVSSDIDSCPLGGKAYCRKKYRHVYYEDDFSGDWCEFEPRCNCAPRRGNE